MYHATIQAAWFNAKTGSGGLKCVFGDSEGILDVDAKIEIVTIKVQGRDPVGLRGLLWGCLRSAIGSFSGVNIKKERVVCGSCEEEVSTRALRARMGHHSTLNLKCESCENALHIEDLLPGILNSSHVDDATNEKYKLICEWIKTPERAKTQGKFFPGQQMAWRYLLTTYLRSFVPVAMQSEDLLPPLLWLPRLSSTR